MFFQKWWRACKTLSFMVYWFFLIKRRGNISWFLMLGKMYHMWKLKSWRDVILSSTLLIINQKLICNFTLFFNVIFWSPHTHANTPEIHSELWIIPVNCCFNIFCSSQSITSVNVSWGCRNQWYLDTSSPWSVSFSWNVTPWIDHHIVSHLSLRKIC